jgi:hypothetical protein
MYSIHYHIKMHESSLNLTNTESAHKKQMFTIGLLRWFKKKRA